MNFETTTPELKNYLKQIFEELQNRGENIAIAFANETPKENTAEFNLMLFTNSAFIYELCQSITNHLEQTLEKQNSDGNKAN